MDLGIWELVIIIGIIVLFFGAKKIPELAKGVGEGITEFKKATGNQIEEGKNNNQQANESVKNGTSEKPKQEAKKE